MVYDPPVIADTITFPLKSLKSETLDIRYVLIKNQSAVSWGSGAAVNNVHLEA
jgi:hypothetical protein